MKVLQLSAADGGGGAGIAALRLQQSLRKQGTDSVMIVAEKTSADPFVVAGMSRRRARWSRRLDRQVCRLLKTPNPSLISPAWIGSGGIEMVRREAADLLHLHWTCSGFLRIEAWPRFQCPLVWTLHDMWMFAGGEHYVGESERYLEGYSGSNRPADERGLDLNRWIWRRKQRALRATPEITFLCVSEWLARCARASALLRDRDIRVLHNGVDLTVFRPQPQATARRELGLPESARLVVFGAINAAGDRRKGFDLLLAALTELREAGEAMELVVFGNAPGSAEVLPSLGFKVHFLGEIEDSARLATIYAACDVAVVPSREEAFGQTAAEALACGTAVVAFRIGGLPEIVTHEVTGFLAAPFATSELARGVQWVLGARNSDAGAALKRQARLAAEQRFSSVRQAESCAAIYDEVIERQGRTQAPRLQEQRRKSALVLDPLVSLPENRRDYSPR